MAKDPQQPNPRPVPPPPPPPRRRQSVPLIGPLLLLALAVAAVLYACKVCMGAEVLAALPVHDPERYGDLAMLAGTLLCVIVIAKSVFSKRR